MLFVRQRKRCLHLFQLLLKFTPPLDQRFQFLSFFIIEVLALLFSVFHPLIIKLHPAPDILSADITCRQLIYLGFDPVDPF